MNVIQLLLPGLFFVTRIPIGTQMLLYLIITRIVVVTRTIEDFYFNYVCYCNKNNK